MIGLTLRTATLAALLSAAACGNAIASECDIDVIERTGAPSAEATADEIEVAGVPSRLWPFYKEYRTLPHYRALVCAGGGMGEPVGCSSVCSASDPRVAIERATANCKKMMQRNYPINSPPCRLRFVGDIDVTGMNRRQIDQVIEQYRRDIASGRQDVPVKPSAGDDPCVMHEYAEKAKCYRKAAEQGSAVAQYNLGLMYDMGFYVAQDFAEAAQLYRKAAEQGYALAQHNLGKMYQYGQGVPQDDVKALLLFKLAAAQGLDRSVKAIDMHAPKMARADISKAERLARKCIEKNYKECGF